jgi:TPP-dependent pyruvate/acetoin dehydrogenase alpha subunit
MLQCRMLAQKCGRKSSLGLEACITAAAIGLQPADVLLPAHGDLLAALVKGMPLRSLLRPASKKSARKKIPALAKQSFANNVILTGFSSATQLKLAAGIGLSCKLNKTGAIVMVFIDDARTLLRDVRKILRFIGEHDLPLILVMLPAQRRIENVWMQFKTFAIPGIPVDGNDAVAVYRVAQEAIARARSGGGPTLIECAQLQTEVDGLKQLEKLLHGKGLWSATQKRNVASKFRKQLSSAFKAH